MIVTPNFQKKNINATGVYRQDARLKPNSYIPDRMAEGRETWYSCVLTEFNPESCLNNPRCEFMLKILKIISLTGALFNLLPFLIICFEPWLRTAPYFNFLLLAISNFVFLLLKYLSIQIYGILKNSSDSVRLVYNILVVSANISSILHIILLSLQQLFLTTFPLKCSIWVTKKRLLFTSIVTWCVSIGSGVLFTFKMVKGQFEEKEDILKGFNIIILVFPTLVFLISQILTLVIRRHRVRAQSTDNSDQNSQNSNKQTFRLTSMVLVAYLLTTTPMYVKEIIQVFVCFITDPWFFVFHHVGTSLALANHALHPLIYIFNVVRFRTIYRHFLAKKLKLIGHSHEASTREERNDPISLVNYRPNMPVNETT